MSAVMRFFSCKCLNKKPPPLLGTQDKPHSSKCTRAQRCRVLYGPCATGAPPAGGAPVTGGSEGGAPVGGGPCVGLCMAFLQKSLQRSGPWGAVTLSKT